MLSHEIVTRNSFRIDGGKKKKWGEGGRGEKKGKRGRVDVENDISGLELEEAEGRKGKGLAASCTRHGATICILPV